MAVKEERNQRIVYKFRVEGKTIRQIGEEENISFQRVCQILEDYGITDRRYNMTQTRMARLYAYIFRFKSENGGNTPTIREMVDGAHLSTYHNFKGAIERLVVAGLVTLVSREKSKNRLTVQIQLIGERYFPPENPDQLLEQALPTVNTPMGEQYALEDEAKTRSRQ